jgi:hypothetical protein
MAIEMRDKASWQWGGLTVFGCWPSDPPEAVSYGIMSIFRKLKALSSGMCLFYFKSDMRMTFDSRPEVNLAK